MDMLVSLNLSVFYSDTGLTNIYFSLIFPILFSVWSTDIWCSWLGIRLAGTKGVWSRISNRMATYAGWRCFWESHINVMESSILPHSSAITRARTRLNQVHGCSLFRLHVTSWVRRSMFLNVMLSPSWSCSVYIVMHIYNYLYIEQSGSLLVLSINGDICTLLLSGVLWFMIAMDMKTLRTVLMYFCWSN